MEPASSIGKPECSLHFRQMDAEESQPVAAAPEKSGEASSLAHRRAEIPLDPVLPIVSKPLSTNPAKGLEYLESIPRPQLGRLLVDGELLSRENGLGCYERREPRCLETLSEGWGVILGWLKKLKPGGAPVITSENLCELHKVVAAHNSEFNPGELLNSGAKFFNLPISNPRHRDINYFDLEGLIEAENIYDKQIAQSSLTDDQAQKKAAFIFVYKDRNIKLTLHLGKNVAAELYRNKHSHDAVRNILLNHKENKHDPRHSRTQQFYSRMADYMDSQRDTCFACFGSRRGEEGVLDEISKWVMEDFSWHIRRKTPPVSELEKLTESTLLRLNKDLAECRDQSELIRLVCRYTTEFQQLHPFTSVNGRTFTLLLQYLLLAYGLPPAILESPQSFLCCGQKQLAADLRSALEDTRTVIQRGNEPDFTLHDYKTPAGDKEYENVCVDLDKVIKGDRADKSIISSKAP